MERRNFLLVLLVILGFTGCKVRKSPAVTIHSYHLANGKKFKCDCVQREKERNSGTIYLPIS